MKATVKCSNCGAEITNLNFGWGKKQWLWMIPLFLVVLFPMWRVYRPKGDYRKDLQIKVLETRKNDSNMEILGTIQNNGKTMWENIELDAEFYGPDGKFVDEASGRVSSSIEAGKTEHFKITIKDAPERITGENVRMELKVADAFSSVF